MIACYILFSPSAGRYYIGVTQESVELRLQKHNQKTYGTKTATAFVNDWELFFLIECTSFAQAVNIERHVKRMKSRTYLKNLKSFPEISQKLLQKYSSIRLSR